MDSHRERRKSAAERQPTTATRVPGSRHLLGSALWLLVCCGAQACSGSLPLGPVWSEVSSSSYYIADVNLHHRPRRFAPTPQYCPETGGTICADVDGYPADHIYHVLTASKTKHFNFTSLFFDERLGDPEPNRNLLPDPPRERVLADLRSLGDLGGLGGDAGGPRSESYLVHHTDLHYNYQHQPHHHVHDDWEGEPAVLPPAFVYHKRDLVKRAPEVDPACPVRTMFVSPKAGLNDRSQWKYVVNVQDRDSRARQVIRVDICRSPDTACSNAISLPFGYVSRCRQKYIKKKLLSLDTDGDGTSVDNFFAPSCCVCELIRDVSKK